MRRPSPGAFLTLSAICLLAVILFGCGRPAPETTLDTIPATVYVAPPPVPTTNHVAAATASAVADPVIPRTTPAPFDCAAYVNALPYEVNNPDPAREAYRVTASCRGWSTETIAKWERFIVDDVMQGESRWCPNVRGGAVMSGVGCQFALDKYGLPRQGTKSDSGIMQLVRLWYQPGGPLCEAEGLCSSDAIIGTPWASFNAGLFAVEHDGRGPWSYNAWARSYHPLWTTVTRYWP